MARLRIYVVWILYTLYPFFAKMLASFVSFKEQLTRCNSTKIILRTKMHEFRSETVFLILGLCLCRVVAIKNYHPGIRIIIQLLQYQNKVWVLFVFVSYVAGLARHNMIAGFIHKRTNRTQDAICYDLEGFGEWLGVVFPTARSELVILNGLTQSDNTPWHFHSSNVSGSRHAMGLMLGPNGMIIHCPIAHRKLSRGDLTSQQCYTPTGCS